MGTGKTTVCSKSGVPTYDEDVEVKVEMTLKNGATASDVITLKISNNKVYFSNLSISADENIPWDEFNHLATLNLGVRSSIPRIRGSINFSSSNESILKLTTAGVRQTDDYGYKVKLIPQEEVGTVTLTMSATDDSGIEQTVSKTITTYESA